MSTQSQTIAALLNNIERAERKHGPLGNNYAALGALHLERREVDDAIQARDNIFVYSELIDEATVCIRRCMEIVEENKARGYTYPQLEE